MQQRQVITKSQKADIQAGHKSPPDKVEKTEGTARVIRNRQRFPELIDSREQNIADSLI